MGRILAIDYGEKRVGIAVSDPLKLIATGLQTIPTAQIFEYLMTYLEKENVECIVVGEPFQFDGKPAQSSKMINKFVEKLKKQFPEMMVDRHDESNTSKEAFQTMIKAGISKKKRRQKELIDEISATLILQSYMENSKR